MSPSTLLLINAQQGLNDPYWGKRNNSQLEKLGCDRCSLVYEKYLEDQQFTVSFF